MRRTPTEARRAAQAIERITRVVRRLRQRGRLTEADAELRSFRCGAVVAVPLGVFRRWQELRGEAERLGASDPREPGAPAR